MDIEAISAMKSAQAMLKAQVSLARGINEQAEAVVSILLEGMIPSPARVPGQTGQQLNIEA